MFNCVTCKEQFQYVGRKEHWATCSDKYACHVERCQDSAKIFESMTQLRDHWMNECNAISLQCSECEGVLTRPETHDHMPKCVQNLKEGMQRLQKLVQDLKAENESWKKAQTLPNPYKEQACKVCRAKPGFSYPYKEEGKEEVKAPEKSSLLEYCVWGHEMRFKEQEKPSSDAQD